MKKLSLEEQLAFATEAQTIAEHLDISLGEACEFVVVKNNLSITPKTLANTISLQRSLPVSQFDMEQYAAVDNEMEPEDERIYDQELVLEQLQKENDRLNKRLLTAENRGQTIMWAIQKCVKALPRSAAPSLLRSVRKGGRKEVAMLDLSDVHLGKKMDSRDTAGICSYDNNIFEDQCQCLIEAVAEIVELQRRSGSQLDTLIINSLGDLVDGEMIYGGHAAEVEVRTIDQIYGLGDYFLMNVLIPLIKLFPNVKIMSVDGNHGRVGHKREGYDRKLNFDGIMMIHWRQRLANFADRVEFGISQSPFMLYKLFDKLHYLSHGANAGSARYPMAGMERQLTSASMLNRQIIDFVHLAHFHRDIKFNFNFSQVLVNGSWVGPTEFSVGKMTAGDFPQQLFYGINPRHITWQYPIYLDKHIRHINRNVNESSDIDVLTPVLSDFDPIELEPYEDSRPILRKSMGQ